MGSNYYVNQLAQTDSAVVTAYILGKLAADPTKVSLEEISRIDIALVEEYRGE